ncbi:hypothetical protein N7466_000773 [Penicillium verhagenii]|uniref:uncharacterized protein n=1 Tax=Penicillium verhagenii TaxID=1562060 RepID=UPI0025453FB6|nr:uncharacterized protein N7466_000773 [Penicillium verhagenii]KAJ5947758.1 hypothetical protein N7466_000773 [Penicillium verhagenii]
MRETPDNGDIPNTTPNAENILQAMTPAPQCTQSVVAAFIDSVVSESAGSPTIEKSTHVDTHTTAGHQIQPGTIPSTGNKPANPTPIPSVNSSFGNATPLDGQNLQRDRGLAAATAAPNGAAVPQANKPPAKRPNEGSEMPPAKVQRTNSVAQAGNPPPQTQPSTTPVFSNPEKRLEERLQRFGGQPREQPIGQINATAPPIGPKGQLPPPERARHLDLAENDRHRGEAEKDHHLEAPGYPIPTAPLSRPGSEHLQRPIDATPAPPKPPVPTYQGHDWGECRNSTGNIEVHFKKYAAFYCNDARKIQTGRGAIARQLVGQWDSYAKKLTTPTWFSFCTFLVEVMPLAGGEENCRHNYNQMYQRENQPVREFVLHSLRYAKSWKKNGHCRLRHLYDRLAPPLGASLDKTWRDFTDYHEFVEYLVKVQDKLPKDQSLSLRAGPPMPKRAASRPPKRRGGRGRG